MGRAFKFPEKPKKVTFKHGANCMLSNHIYGVCIHDKHTGEFIEVLDVTKDGSIVFHDKYAVFKYNKEI